MMEKLRSRRTVEDAEGKYGFTRHRLILFIMMADSGARGSAAQIRQLSWYARIDG